MWRIQCWKRHLCFNTSGVWEQTYRQWLPAGLGRKPLITFFAEDKINFIGIHEGEGGKAAIFIESERDVSTIIGKFHLGIVEGSIMKVRLELRDTSLDELIN